MKETVYYSDCWFKVDFEVYEHYVKFTAFKITGLDETNLSKSDCHEFADIEGSVKWDSNLNFKSEGSSFGGVWEVEQFLQLIKNIYQYGFDKGVLHENN